MHLALPSTLLLFLPLLASAQRPLYARNPYAYAEAEPYALADAYAEADAYAFADPYAAADPYPFPFPGSKLSKQTKTPQCDSHADSTCTQGKPCKTGHYSYDGNHPYRAKMADTCGKLCDCV